MADDFDIDVEPQRDPAAAMGSGLVILTTVILIAAWPSSPIPKSLRMKFGSATAESLRARGWDGVDVVFVTGDAYVDHPSFAMAILGRVLEAAGRYVVDLQEKLSNIVAEETYRQWTPDDVRTLESDIVFVTLAGDVPWVTTTSAGSRLTPYRSL